jgi:predicted ATP-dependent Lon-type protease
LLFASLLCIGTAAYSQKNICMQLAEIENLKQVLLSVPNEYGSKLTPNVMQCLNEVRKIFEY